MQIAADYTTEEPDSPEAIKSFSYIWYFYIHIFIDYCNLTFF